MEWLAILTGGLLASAATAHAIGSKNTATATAPKQQQETQDLEFNKIDAHSRPQNPMQPNHLQRKEPNWLPPGQGKRVNMYRSYAILTPTVQA